jgi:DNA-directed RNA polymerase specialized sigma54-like protein
MKLLQVPTASIEERIKEELEDNPALEQGEDEETRRRKTRLKTNLRRKRKRTLTWTVVRMNMKIRM